MWGKKKNEKKVIDIQVNEIRSQAELNSLLNHMFDPEHNAYDHGFVDFLKCKECDGKYVLRNGKYGMFYGCNHYPRCHSTQSIADMTYNILLENGLAIYEVEDSCWKCHKPIKIVSYFPYFDLCKVDSNLMKLNNLLLIRLSLLDGVDKKVEADYSHVKKTFSKKAGYSYIANTCPHCGALQGCTIALQNAFERLNQSFQTEGVQQYIGKRIVINENILPKEEWEEVINEIKEMR